MRVSRINFELFNGVRPAVLYMSSISGGGVSGRGRRIEFSDINLLSAEDMERVYGEMYEGLVNDI